MTKHLILTTLLLTNQLSLSMKQNDQGRFGWLTTTSNTNQELSTEKPKSTAPLTPLEKCSQLAVKKTKEIEQEANYGNMADLIEIVHHAKTKEIIQPHELGKFIFTQSSKDTNHILASLCIARIGKYLETMDQSNTHHLTRIELKVNKINRLNDDEQQRKRSISQSQHAISMLNLGGTVHQPKPEEQIDILACDLYLITKTTFPITDMAEILYANIKPTEDQEPETK
jgi:hypothetical protein